MVTYLYALRCAVNVEHMLQELQRRRFALTGDTGARALPPLIPLHRHTEAPDPAWLDDIRRTHTVSLPRVAGVPAKIPPARIALISLPGCQETTRQISALQGALAPSGSTPVFPAQIVLSWQDEPAHQSPVKLPETSAFWLSVFQCDPGEDPWWEYLTWREVYCRRLKARSH